MPGTYLNRNQRIAQNFRRVEKHSYFTVWPHHQSILVNGSQPKAEISPSHTGTSPASNEKKEDRPVRHPQHPPRPRATKDRPRSRDEIITTPYTAKHLSKAAIFADSAGANRGPGQSRVSLKGAGGSFHQPGWDLWLLWETKKRSITIEMILLGWLLAFCVEVGSKSSITTAGECQ